ncbi:hypothetical protein J7M00_09105 [bacterium]|nr:hypothetical protein [bacterium]
MKNFFIITLSLVIAVLYSSASGENSQELLYKAHKLWSSGDCSAAMSNMEKVISRLNDFPADARKQVQATYIAWQDTIERMRKISFEISSSLPELYDENGEPLPLPELQNVPTKIKELLKKLDEITCTDMKLSLKRMILSKQDTANLLIDRYIDIIIGENARLSSAVDSLRRIAKRYSYLLPVLDSLRSMVAKNSQNLKFLQAQIDSMVAMASQSITLTGKNAENKKEISAPTTMMSRALLRMVENRIIAIGEGKVRNQNYSESERDTILSELTHIYTWLDTSTAAKLSPERASFLKNLTTEYIGAMEVSRRKSNTFIYILLAFFIVIILLAVAQTLRRRGR